MTDLLAIVEHRGSDEELVDEIARRRPRRVTVLVEGHEADDGLRDDLARLIHAIESRTGAVVVGMVGDQDQLEGWRFDRVVRVHHQQPLAA